MHRVDSSHPATIELTLERAPYPEPVSLFADLPREVRLVDREVDVDDDEEMFRPFEL